MSDTTDYEYAARESHIAGLEQGAKRVLSDMTTDEKLTEIVWFLRKAEKVGLEVFQSAQKNPMLSMLFKK